MKKRKSRLFWLGLLTLIFSFCNHNRPCFKLTLDLTQEPYGATDINAISGNQGLSVGFNQEGTITVFKWPNPSYYDQVKYMTTSRDKPGLGALPNEGVFTGIFYETDSGQGFFWLRELEHHQEYLGPKSVVVRTSFSSKELGLKIDQIDFVETKNDVLWRHYKIDKQADSRIKSVRLMVFANFAPKISKWNSLPLTDWCLDSFGNSTLKWSKSDEAFVQFRQGKDISTGKPSSVFLVFGLDKKTISHHAGLDSFCSLKKNPQDPFVLAKEGNLAGSDFAEGKVSAGLSAEMDLTWQNSAQLSFLVAVSETEKQALSLIQSSREKGFDSALRDVEAHWEKLLEKVPLPQTDNQRIKEVALRSVIVLLLGYCRDSSAIVASMSTQPPYGLDWPRDGSYINEALIAAGFGEMVRKHNLFYARVQSQPGHKLKYVPEGNWASNYYADGVPGMPFIVWEIDETAFGIWTLYRYYELTQDRAYLEAVYPAIKRSGDFLAEFKDERTGLARKAFENDIPFKEQTLRGSLCAWLGLKYAIKASEAMGDNSSLSKWQERQKELERVIYERFYDPACKSFVRLEEWKGDCHSPGAEYDQALMFWPAGMINLSQPEAQDFAINLWKFVEPAYSGKKDRGAYEVYALLSLAKLWKSEPEKMEMIRNALLWTATVPITETGHFGEVWATKNGRIYPGEAQPQLWHHSLFYLTALEAFEK